MPDATERPYILHMLTATPQMSPFDVNMAADAGYQVIVPYCNVGAENVVTLTQDAIFSRGPKGVSRTGIFIGGRDVMLAADMLDTQRGVGQIGDQGALDDLERRRSQCRRDRVLQ